MGEETESFSKAPGIWRAVCSREIVEGGMIMKASQSVVFASLVSSLLLTLAAPAYAALRSGSYNRSQLSDGIAGDRNQIRQERGQLDEDRRDRHLDREE